jgi:uncharacterized protein YkwD
MKSFFLLLITTILAASAFGQASFAPVGYSAEIGSIASAGALTPSAIRALERDAFQLINTERSHAGLPALKWSDKIAEVARLHSNDMAAMNFFSHKGLDGLMVDARAEKLNMGPWTAIGENIAFMKGYENPVAVAIEKWLQSPGHKKNLLNPDWTETAIGLAVTADGKYYFTQVFIRN